MTDAAAVKRDYHFLHSGMLPKQIIGTLCRNVIGMLQNLLTLCVMICMLHMMHPLHDQLLMFVLLKLLLQLLPLSWPKGLPTSQMHVTAVLQRKLLLITGEIARHCAYIHCDNGCASQVQMVLQ